MYFLRKHWYDLGAFFTVLVLAYVWFSKSSLSNYQLLMWLSLGSLFLHQLEEYRIIGTFPGMINRVMFKSNQPDRYPLNTNTTFLINVFLGWGIYFFSAFFAEKAIWLGIAAILVSFGNTIAHTFLFNLKGKTFYNAGMATCWLLFVPCIYFFISITNKNNLVSTTDLVIGLLLGVALNYLGVLKVITWLANANTTYVFDKRNLLSNDRKG